jgi:heme oxygenase
MKEGLFGQQLTLMEELKAASFSSHTRLQTLPFFEALAACQLPLESYVGQLRSLAVIHGVIEQALAQCGDQRIASVWTDDMRKLHLLLQDLKYFEPRTVADLKGAVDSTQNAAHVLRLMMIEDPISLLGCMYVLEGSTLGATVVRPMVARALLLDGTDGTSYLSSYGLTARAKWVGYAQRMNALLLTPQERSQVSIAANQLFKLLESVLHSLYPFEPESKTYLVTSINPDAGRHPVPSDSREVEAAVRAGDICWELFPYFELRYGERGRRFARSDAAWQATLCHYPAKQILQQVKWLGRVLAGRGMPTLLLQVQLEILATELSMAIPDSRAKFQTILPAAAELHATRGKHLSDEKVKDIADEFDRAAGPEWVERMPRTGALLCAAVADELAGNSNAIGSLRTWMTDPTRFPAQWIAAVEATLKQASANSTP